MATPILPHDHGSHTLELLEHKPTLDAFEKASNTFQLISDTTRLKILWLLCHSEECVINIAAAIDMSSPAVSHHLRVLKQAGLLTMRREGKEAYYTLADTEEADLVHKIVDSVFDMNCKR
ncbi:metalloregulator ArsR/SmtB family transcription factor [Anaerovorax odorimutans]|uniref:Metalloregulator ArsR/SmtB family transcription factor n=1 Tax=Anaerovorax odorimutans TaxID=109327 RepID=A0ABT1RNR6_9FIRM|nr:metalloregulator ArsR/SmtB family transcription factor [Anaerovorax odorimutans]MCQ4636827.1 metalloregulator ArsR/SmtB family transcription factor [Anaerovorax odorimutans]